MVDYFSLKWMEVDVIRSTTNAAIIWCRDRHVAPYVVPVDLRSDTGPYLVSEEMEKYLKETSIVHHPTTPLWQGANEEV